MANLDAALAAVRSVITSTLNNAGLIGEPGQVYVGWPTATELHEVAHQPGAGSQVTIWPLGDAKSTARYHPSMYVTSTTTPGTTASIDSTSQILTIAGTPMAGDLIHAFFSKPTLDAFYEAQTNDTPTTVATKLRTAALAEAPAGVTIAQNASALTMEGAYWTKVNIGQTAAATATREVNRIAQTFQVSVWAPNAQERSDIASAIVSNIGGTQQSYIQMSDGQAMYFRFCDQKNRDQAQEAYSIYRADLLFKVEYPITQTVTMTTVESLEGTIITDGGSPVTVITGGS